MQRLHHTIAQPSRLRFSSTVFSLFGQCGNLPPVVTNAHHKFSNHVSWVRYFADWPFDDVCAKGEGDGDGEWVPDWVADKLGFDLQDSREFD